jgi:GT2 family glycosyltransferase
MLHDISSSGEFFDPSFFAFFEDVDLALRARAAGWTSIFVPDAQAVHKRGGSNTRGALVQFYAFRNRLRIIIKSIPLSTLLAQAPVLVAYDLLRLIWVSVSNPLALSSYSQVLKEMGRLLEKRREILKS